VCDEVRRQFVNSDHDSETAFRPSAQGRWLADIYELARLRLVRKGVQHIYGASRCTFSEPEHFFSYRRDGNTGRMTTMIWIEDDN
jgi:copper oxidase (laccase) domain-containing protein